MRVSRKVLRETRGETLPGSTHHPQLCSTVLGQLFRYLRAGHRDFHSLLAVLVPQFQLIHQLGKVFWPLHALTHFLLLLPQSSAPVLDQSLGSSGRPIDKKTELRTCGVLLWTCLAVWQFLLVGKRNEYTVELNHIVDDKNDPQIEWTSCPCKRKHYHNRTTSTELRVLLMKYA